MDAYVVKGRQIIARLDRLTIWPYPFHYLVILGIGFFFGFYDILTISFALPKIQQEFTVNLDEATWTITSSLAGYIIGSFFISRIADKLGRRLGLILSISFFSIGSLACALSFNLSWLIIWRFVTGIGIGAEIASVTTYMEELAPALVRGRSTCKAIAYGMFGFAIVPFLAYFLIPNFDYGWRILFFIGGVAGIFIYFTRRFLPDSPRWLVLQNKLASAEDIITKAELLVRKKGVDISAKPLKIIETPRVTDTSFRNFLSLSIMKRVIQFVALWFIYYIGNYAWLTLAPSFFIEKGFNLSQSIGFIAISSFGFILGSLISIVISENFERKWSAIVIALIWSIALMVIGFFPYPVVIVLSGFIATTTIATIIPILYIYTGENFPTRFRATSLAITDGLGHLGGAFCGQIIFLISYLIVGKSHDYQAAFIIMSVTGLLAAVILLFGMNMTQHSLSDIPD